jgi:gas vesicle structural protein
MSIMSQTGLYDVVDLILERGLVIDAFVRVSVISIELVTVDARVVVAGIDTYLRFAEAANRIEIGAGQSSPLAGLLGRAPRAVGQGSLPSEAIARDGQKARERSK